MQKPRQRRRSFPFEWSETNPSRKETLLTARTLLWEKRIGPRRAATSPRAPRNTVRRWLSVRRRAPRPPKASPASQLNAMIPLKWWRFPTRSSIQRRSSWRQAGSGHGRVWRELLCTFAVAYSATDLLTWHCLTRSPSLSCSVSGTHSYEKWTNQSHHKQTGPRGRYRTWLCRVAFAGRVCLERLQRHRLWGWRDEGQTDQRRHFLHWRRAVEQTQRSSGREATSGHYGFQSPGRLRRNHHLRSDAAAQNQGAGRFLHPRGDGRDCETSASWPVDHSRVDHLSGNNGRSFAPDVWREGFEARRGFPFGVFAGACWPRQPAVSYAQHSESCWRRDSRFNSSRRTSLFADR